MVYTRPNMFEVADNMYNLMGLGELKNLFTVENYKTKHKSVVWYYPERFLNIIEQRVLVSRAEKAGYEEVQIVTHSVYIVQTVDSKNVRVYNGEPFIPEPLYEDANPIFKLSHKDSGMPNDSGLGVLGGSIL